MRHYNPLLIWNHSWFQTARDYKPQILDPNIEEFPCLVHRLSVTLFKHSTILTAVKNGLKNIQTLCYWCKSIKKSAHWIRQRIQISLLLTNFTNFVTNQIYFKKKTPYTLERLVGWNIRKNEIEIRCQVG